MNLSGIKGLASMAVIVLLVSGCSTPAPESKPEYDELEVKRYEICLQASIDYFEKLGSTNAANMVYAAEENCEELKPVKK